LERPMANMLAIPLGNAIGLNFIFNPSLKRMSLLT
jgi:hypothetical protein